MIHLTPFSLPRFRRHLAMVPFLFLLFSLSSCSQQESEGIDGERSGKKGAGNPAGRGRMVSSELIGEKTLRQIEVEFKGKSVEDRPSNGVRLYRIIYSTIDPHGNSTIASGALAIPQGTAGPFPLLSYQHGTVASRKSVASVYGFDLSSIVFGGSGYVVASPDYLGLGESPGFHPYVHAASLATSIVDMLRAAREFCAKEGITLNDQLFLIGYSEGGHATMATHKAIESEYGGEFTVTASAPMAGPYDMSGTMRELFMSDATYANPFYMPYVILAYNDLYPLADSLEAIFVQPYARRLPSLFDGSREGFAINRELPTVPKAMLNPEFLHGFRTDSLHPLQQALRDNDLLDWTPRAPMRLYHCTDDNQVPFRNSQVAYDSFKRRGATQVELVRLGYGNHGPCGYPSIMEGKEWFDSLVSRKGAKEEGG